MRMDDHRLHIAATTHIRTGVEDIGRAQMQLAEHVDTQDKEISNDLEKKLQGIKDKVNEAVPQLVEAKLSYIQATLDSIQKTENEMKNYLNELEKTSPRRARSFSRRSSS